MTSVIARQGKETGDWEEHELPDFVIASASFVFDPLASASVTFARLFPLGDSHLLSIECTALVFDD